ncbi:MarR family winged helix-turn-helix transcriptional regulator [Falsirhodobacter algicola]|uniref:MarR family transcriptional regulator n=1 Tax=Falsirhodobacter algicola TaxID=2692330 RepID=A0A8J8SK29_9RHOB|nr:MarR family transcriptional regulator [Falsirhodobacter algicola]QUS35038.1 MarR family transcriptional regulator [Falsirhodobacter algicola]
MPSPAESFLDHLVKVNRKLRTAFDARAREQGLTLSRARLLVTLARQDGQTQTQLAQALEVEQPSIVGLVDALVKAGMVERREGAGDRRTRCIHLTPAARKDAQALLDYVATLRAEFFAGIPEDDLRSATAVLERVLANTAPPS